MKRERKIPLVVPIFCFQVGSDRSSASRRMSESKFREVLPKQGMLAVEDVTTMVLCKPKLLPLKSVTLEKLEKMQREAQETIRQQEQLAQESSKSVSVE
ncbi:BBSome-interacting protein 1 isoform X2 [Pogona vitticeps]|uniref:BBSome-interacting protein 1 isoform X1 n=2 Tax=Pogona vitticeps TaxID=103695 RepID=A0A6J0SKY9_9SAUR